jgi:hypothetical protein
MHERWKRIVAVSHRVVNDYTAGMETDTVGVLLLARAVIDFQRDMVAQFKRSARN